MSDSSGTLDANAMHASKSSTMGVFTRGYSDSVPSSGKESTNTEGMVLEYIEVTHQPSRRRPKKSSKRSRKSISLSSVDAEETETPSLTSSISVAPFEQCESVETSIAGCSWDDEVTKTKQASEGVSETDDETTTDESRDVEVGTISSRKGEIPERRESELPAHEDPFAPRPGRSLKWSNVNMRLAATRKTAERTILNNIWGEVPRKEVTAIMGPSGAGKTSLLNILAGRASSNGRLKIDGDIRLDGYSVNPKSMKVRRLIAFVAQDDSLQVTATPREAIRFSARLRLPRSTTDRDIRKLTNRMLTELGLNDCADTVIGGALVKGISGGERKRASVGVELCCKPDLLFLDEPTSGLDSFSAEQLCQVLKKVANAGASVLFTIHQPASEIFSSFDHLILLNQGRVMYQGSVSSIPRYFAKRGHPCPPHHNPADWIMNRAKVVSISDLEKAGFFPSDDTLTKEEKIPFDSAAKKILFERDTSAELDPRPAASSTQIREMLRREFINVKRDKIAIAGRVGITAVLSLMIGAIYQGVGKTDSAVIGNLQSHFGALVLCCLLCMIGTAQPALLAFPQERPVFVREYSTNHYSVFSYFVSRFVIEAFVTFIQVIIICTITYLMIEFRMSFFTYLVTNYALAMTATALSVAFGCQIEDPTLGQELFPLLFVPQMLFSGFFITPSLIPSWLQWGRYVCALTFGLLITMIEEFGDCGKGFAQTNCNILLDTVEADANNTVWYWSVLVALFFAFRLVALALLHKKASKFF